MVFDIKQIIEANRGKFSDEDLRELEHGHMRQSDYDRSMNRLKNDYAQRDQELTAHEQKLEQWRVAREQELLKAEAFESRYGSLDRFLVGTGPDAGMVQSPTGHVFNRGEIDSMKAALATTQNELRETREQLGKVAAGTIQLVTTLPDLAQDYREKFGKRMDMQKFDAFCGENRIEDLNIGFKLFTAEDEADLREKKYKEDIKAAKEEGAREYATRHGMPNSGTEFRRVESPLTRSWRPTTVSSQDAPATPPTHSQPPTYTPTPQPYVAPGQSPFEAARLATAANVEANSDQLRHSIQEKFNAKLRE